MSFNRLNYDTNTYKQNLYQSVGPGEYRLVEPPNTEEGCFAESPHIRMQFQGVSVDSERPLIDVDSELLNLTRPATNCPSRKYIPDGSQCGLTNPKAAENNKTHGKSCLLNVEDTRLSNPPCTLRGTGWNRWEWLCQDPQERVLIPFDNNVSNRLLFKDVSYRFLKVGIKEYPLYLLNNKNKTIEVNNPSILKEYADVLFEVINYRWVSDIRNL